MPKDPVLDEVMIELSDKDVIRFRDCIEGGILITGGLGSGKSSTSARTIALSFLRSGKGGLVLTVKADETEHWIRYAKETGREKDRSSHFQRGEQAVLRFRGVCLEHRGSFCRAG